MMAPSRTVTSTRATATAPRRRDAGAQRVRSRAVQRAYARRAQHTGTSRAARDRVDAAHRASFVLLMMVVSGVALVATLWLSTAAAADSYALRSDQERARNLTERSENLAREVA
ncbi:MAG TPA: septum formation initiator, partial [Pseudonocardiaceae bacterium]|nr:septum formation initiator [Pseudonocardiaceae bacterium]